MSLAPPRRRGAPQPQPNRLHRLESRHAETSSRLPRATAPWALLLLLLLLLGLITLPTGCQSDSPCGLIQPVSAIPIDQCPVTEVTSASLMQNIDPMTSRPRFSGKTYVYNPPTKAPKTGTQFKIWPLWNRNEPTVCRTCASVCDRKAVTRAAKRGRRRHRSPPLC